MMTLKEARLIADMVQTIHEGCATCVDAKLRELEVAFPQFSWSRSDRDVGHEAWAVEVRAVHGFAPPMDLAEHVRRQAEFSLRTFGPGRRTAMVVDHIRKELAEIEAAPDDPEEWIDVALLALDGAWRTGASPEEVVQTWRIKFERNLARTWPDWRTVPGDQAIHHEREEGE